MTSAIAFRSNFLASPLGPAQQVSSTRQHDASPDDWYIGHWLESSASRSTHTERSYRKEITRWRAFLTALHGCYTPDLVLRATYAHVTAFLEWIEASTGPDLPPDVASIYKLSDRQARKPKSSLVVARQAVLILHAFYEEASGIAPPPGTDPGLLQGLQFNPFETCRRKFTKKGARSFASAQPQSPDAAGVAKALPKNAWDAVWIAACAPAPAGAASRLVREAARRRLVVAVMRATWERRHAVAGITWQDIRKTRKGIWCVRRMRKVHGATWAPIPTQLIDELALFRQAIGQPWPVPDTPAEQARSVFWIGDKAAGHKGPVADETIYRIIKDVFQSAAADCLAAEDLESHSALVRAGAGPHTIRHTMATMYMDAGGELRDAQHALGHDSIASTSIYISTNFPSQLAELERQWETSASS